MEISEQKMEGEAPLPSCQVPGQGAAGGADTFQVASLNRITEAFGATGCSKPEEPGDSVRHSSSELAGATPTRFHCAKASRNVGFFSLLFLPFPPFTFLHDYVR